MTVHIGHWIGLGGVAPDDSRNAHLWEKRLDGLMIAIAVISVPVAIIDVEDVFPWLRALANSLHWLILLAFLGELMWMLHVCERKLAYLARNWLNVIIIVVAILGLAGLTQGIWLALARLARLALVGLLFARAASGIGSVMVARGVPLIFGLSFLLLLLAGAGFYFLEPTVRSFGDGLWLAFVTGATVGYGDLVPTTTASRIFAVIMVLVGFALLSMVTATISAFFVGEGERRAREELHRDIRQLREEVRSLRDELIRMRRGDRARPGGDGPT